MQRFDTMVNLLLTHAEEMVGCAFSLDKGSFDQALSEDCDDPELFRTLAGFGDEFPYSEPNQPVPSTLE
jgi:hypothetical protein